jgi:hypothetical protein
MKINRWRRRMPGVLIAAIFVVALAAPGAASATSCGGRLPGHDWTTCGVQEEVTVVYGKVEEGGGSREICVGTVTHNGSGYHFPYGWDCAVGTVEAEFPRTLGYGGVYNDSVTEYRFGLESF